MLYPALEMAWSAYSSQKATARKENWMALAPEQKDRASLRSSSRERARLTRSKPAYGTWASQHWRRAGLVALTSLGMLFASCTTPHALRPENQPGTPATVPSAQAANQQTANTKDASTQTASPAAPDKQGAAPVPAKTEAYGASTTAPAGNAAYPIHGSLTTSYRGRFSGGDQDHDLSEVLSVDVGDPAKNDWSAHVMTRLNEDLDGQQNSGSSKFHDLYDTEGNSVVAHVYDAWVEKRNVGPLDLVRVGRQTIWDTPVFAWFDGASAELHPIGPHDFHVGLYGGVPVQLYGASSRGDSLAGAFANASPWKDGRVRLDWMHLADDADPASHTNDLWRTSAWQSFGQNLRVDGWFTGLDGEERDYQARVTWADPASAVTLSASWFELLQTQKDLAPEIDPFFTTLFELFPYHQARLLASKDFSDHVSVQTGVDTRHVDDSNDVGRFNRDSDREFATLALTDVTRVKLDLSLTGENWNGAGSDIQTWGFDVTKRFSQEFRASVGSYYALFKVDSFQVDERDHVRTAYARLRWHRTKNTTWDLRYEIEDAAGDTYQFVRVGMTWAF